MKMEISIEEKAKAYDEAYKFAEYMHKYSSDPAEIKCMEDIFPELKESEDEKIRKVIADIVKAQPSDSLFNGTKEKCLAWLEKQGEQKPAWSEEDEKMFDYALDMIEWYSGKNEDKSRLVSNWFKSLKNRVGCEANCTTTKEWSEEDKKKVNTLYVFLDQMVSFNMLSNKDASEFKDWLKSLGLQNRWKPSDEQMEALNAINVIGSLSYAGQGQELINLYNDLKKLKE